MLQGLQYYTRVTFAPLHLTLKKSCGIIIHEKSTTLKNFKEEKTHEES